MFVSLITQEYNGRVNHLSERAHYSRRRQGAGRRRAGCAQRDAWHWQLVWIFLFFFLIRPCAAPFSHLMPTEDASRWLAGCPRPSPPQRPRGWMEDARPRTRGFCCRRRGGRVPVAAPRTRADPGGTTGKAGEPISHLACCASASPCSLLASPPAKRLSALPGPCNRHETRATLISAISPLLFP